ncbi:hypothetical protein M2277_002918 [Paenibacillus sp. LBL]|nr:hypothetical protein [Paenibacillus sp. LBL]
MKTRILDNTIFALRANFTIWYEESRSKAN